MATTGQLTQLHRRRQLALRAVVLADMRRLWPALSWEDLDGTYASLAGATAQMVANQRKTSAGLAAAYLRAHRVASGLDGNVRVVIPEFLNPEQFDAALHSTTVASIKKAAARSVAADLAMSNALTLASGAMARLVLDAGRQTITQTVKADDRATGWRRILGTGGCDFCRLLAGRVYPSDNADFEAHGKCGCTSEPVFE